MESKLDTYVAPKGKLEILMLGTGTSHGVPMIGCNCEVCTSPDPRDKRNRSSVLITQTGHDAADSQSLLIDTTPELRIAAIKYGIQRVDAVALTHSHADHILGMDDLRRYNNILGRQIACYANARTMEVVRTVFGYAERPYNNPDRPALRFETIEDAPFKAAGMKITPIPLMHGEMEITGYRIGQMAYCTDCSFIPKESYKLLQGLDLLILNALRYRPHPAHFSLSQALAAIERIAPKRALLTHIAHQIKHEKTSRELPDNVELAYDGQRVELDYLA